MNNLNVSLILHNIAQLLKIEGANRYKIDAYEQASKKIKQLSEDIEAIAKNEGWTSLEGIGSGLAEKIDQILSTGSCDYYEELTAKYPTSLIPLLSLRGVGSSKVRKFTKELGITNLDQLKSEAKAGKLTELSGIGKKTEEKILSSISKAEQVLGKLNLAEGGQWANSLRQFLLNLDFIEQAEIVGELRRQEELITELSFLVDCNDVDALQTELASLPVISNLIETDSKQIKAATELGVKFIFHLSSAAEFAADFFWLTGTEEFNQELKINFSKLTPVETEEEVFNQLKLPYIIPELRDDPASIKAARNDNLPNSIIQSDIKGDLHLHSTWSDGRVTIEEMAAACQKRGYEYLAITDHTQALTVANGLDYDELKEQREEINELNEKMDIKILAGAEVDILADELDYENHILEELDIVIASIHSNFEDSKEQMMSRISLALENPQVNILGHPTGRLLAARESYQIDFVELADKAAETGTCLEINASPQRLDLDGYRIRQAQEKGVEFVICTDAHHPDQLANISYGVRMARKGWLEAEQIINTYSLAKLKETLNKK